jgi:hypothetical protein
MIYFFGLSGTILIFTTSRSKIFAAAMWLTSALDRLSAVTVIEGSVALNCSHAASEFLSVGFLTRCSVRVTSKFPKLLNFDRPAALPARFGKCIPWRVATAQK